MKSWIIIINPGISISSAFLSTLSMDGRLRVEPRLSQRMVVSSESGDGFRAKGHEISPFDEISQES